MKDDTFLLGAKAVIKNKKGQVLLLKTTERNINGRKKFYWDLPGGRVRNKKSILNTLKREVKEETGIIGLKNIKPYKMIISKIRVPIKSGTAGLILSIYNCDPLDVKIIKLSKEHQEFKWVNKNEMNKLLSFKYPSLNTRN